MCHFFCNFAPEMLCNHLHSALSAIIQRYDQVCIVGDASVKTDEFGLPALWLEVSEENKTLETVSRIWDFLFEQNMTRRGLIIAIGGGVLTDLAGFAAATYKRGMDYINIPTTLLAMVDASSGGKTGCNYRGLKNSIGAFHTPVETLVWPRWLDTLPARQFLSGYAEMLKTGLLDGDALWNSLLRYDLDRMDINALTPLIADCIAVKQRIVDADPRESGMRKALNLGHTFGHALEELQMLQGASSNGQWLHGYAVMYGLIAELYLSVTLHGCPREPLQQLTRLMLLYYGRPECNCKDRQRLITLMLQDKKNECAAEINCTLLDSVGHPLINQTVSAEQADEAWDYLLNL